MEKKKMKPSTKMRLKVIATGVLEILAAPILGPINWVIGGVTTIVMNKASSLAYASEEESNKMFEESFGKKQEENEEN